MNKLFSSFILGVIFVTGFGCQMVTTDTDLTLFEPMGLIRDERSFGDYTVKIYELNQGSFEILKNGVQMYADSGHRFEIGSIYEEEKAEDAIRSNGVDITGDGQPNLIVSEWTGGAHCCFLFHIFDIGPDFRLIQTINAKHADLADFKNLDDTPDLEFLMADFTFAYWRVSFAASPAPEVVLKYNGEKYEMACDLMRKPGLSQKDLNQLAADIKSWQGWADDQPPSILWGEMLNLIYTGNRLQAWDLVDLSWPEGVEGKDQFLKEFKLKIQTSPFWESVQKLNQSKYITTDQSQD